MLAAFSICQPCVCSDTYGGSPFFEAPSIITQPASQSVLLGQTVTSTVIASRTGPPSYQWNENGVVVVGCNHGIQPEGADELFGDSEQVRQQKKEFAKLIENLVKVNDIQFIGEEWGLAAATSAHTLADANKKSWVDINTSFEELDAMKIPRDYVQGAYSAEQKQKWTGEREAVMVKKVREGRGKATKYLVICGFEHAEPLADNLREDCKTVERVDYRQQQWYQDGVFAE